MERGIDLFYLKLGKKCRTISLTCALTVDLQADCDVHGACYIHRSADICPSILWDGSFNIQTAITPQEHPPIQLNLRRRETTAVTQEHGEDLRDVQYVFES